MLGWTRTDAVEGIQRDFYVRQLWDAKGSPMVDVLEPPAFAYIAKVCGTELARAHARSGDSLAIASYLGSSDAFERAVAAFAESYADQNERDYAALEGRSRIRAGEGGDGRLMVTGATRAISTKPADEVAAAGV